MINTCIHFREAHSRQGACVHFMHVIMDLYYEWKGLILHLAYRQGYLLSLLGGGENMEFPGGTGEMESGISPGVN